MADSKEKKAAEIKVVPEQDREFARAADAVLRTEAGRKLWALLAKRMGFFTSSIRRTSAGEIAPLSTEALEAQRLVYLELRTLPTYELLIAAEGLADPTNKTLSAKPLEERKK
jgi:hypothetical protein